MTVLCSPSSSNVSTKWITFLAALRRTFATVSEQNLNSIGAILKKIVSLLKQRVIGNMDVHIISLVLHLC